VSDAPNLIDLLSRQDPNALSSLRDRYPAQTQLLSSERLLGREAAASSIHLDPAKRVAVIELIMTSMTQMTGESDALSIAIRATMKRVSVIRYVGSLIASISGGVAGILIIVLSNDVIQAITAFMAMLGGMAAVTADQFERAPSGIRIASADEYGKLIEMRSNIEMIRLRISRDKVIPIQDEDIRDMLTQLDRYAASVIRLKMA
jgi:hypothetical protein